MYSFLFNYFVIGFATAASVFLMVGKVPAIKEVFFKRLFSNFIWTAIFWPLSALFLWALITRSPERLAKAAEKATNKEAS